MAAHARDKLAQRQEKLEVGYSLDISIRNHLVRIDCVALPLVTFLEREKNEEKSVTVYMTTVLMSRLNLQFNHIQVNEYFVDDLVAQ